MNEPLFTFKGEVIRGSGIGKKLNLPPTMNLDVPAMPEKLFHGIYAVQLSCNGQTYDGVMHYGPRPAVDAPLSCEVHCFGLQQELYGAHVSVEGVAHIREVKNFSSIDELRLAIDADIVAAKKILAA